MNRFENPAKPVTQSYQITLRELEGQLSACALFNRGEAARRVGNHNLATSLFRRCVVVGCGEGNRVAMAWGYWGLATLRRLGGEFETALALYRTSAECGTAAGNANCVAWSRAGQAEIIRHRRDHTTALKQHENLLGVFRQNLDRVGQLWALQGIGQIHLVNGSPQAKELFRRAEDAAGVIGDLRAAGFSRRALAVIARQEGDLDHARICLSDAEQLFTSLDYRVGSGFVLREMSHCELLDGSLEEAERYAREALVCFEGGCRIGQAWTLATLAQVEREKQHKRSEITLAKSSQLFSDLGVDLDLRVPQATYVRRIF